MDMYKIIIGVDPGASGAITWAKVKDNKLTMVPEVLKMPKDFEGLNKAFKEIAGKLDRCLCFVEKVQMWRSDDRGKQFAMVKMLKNYELLKAALEINHIGYIETHPMTWQSYLKLKLPKGQKEDKPQRKRRYKIVAQDQYKDIKCTLTNCDALLLLTFGIRKLQQDQQWILKNIPDIDRDLLF